MYIVFNVRSCENSSVNGYYNVCLEYDIDHFIIEDLACFLDVNVKDIHFIECSFYNSNDNWSNGFPTIYINSNGIFFA